MDSSSNKQPKKANLRAEPKPKLPNIHKSVKYCKFQNSQSGSASTSSSEDWSSETVFPQIEKSNSRSKGVALDIVSTNNNAVTNTSSQNPSPEIRPRSQPTSGLTSRATPRASILLNESSKMAKRLIFKKRSTMTLLSPTLSDIEDAITRHGPYEGQPPVLRMQTYDEATFQGKMSLRGVMSVIDQVSAKEVGFDPDQLIRTDPTVAKAVCEILKEYTDEDNECLTRIALAICDDQMSNNEVLRVLEDNVQGRTEENIAVYFAMAFFISKTKDPTTMQSSNSALTTDVSPSESKTIDRSERSVSFLMNALDKYMILAQRVASLISNDSTSDPTYNQRRQSFLELAAVTPRISIVDRSRRHSMYRSFDFETPSGWFFEEVEVDQEIVDTIRQSVPAMIDFVINQRLSLSQVAEEERGSKESPRSKKQPRSPTKDAKKSQKTTGRQASQALKKAKGGKRGQAKGFHGWDLTTDLAPHWSTRLPKETDMVIPILQRIRKCQRKDTNQLSKGQWGRRESDGSMSMSQSRLGSSGSSELKAQLEHDLKIKEFTEQLAKQDLDRNIGVEMPSPSLPVVKPPRLQTVPTVTPRRTMLAEPQESVQEYLARHRVIELFGDLISTLVVTMPTDPLDTLIDRVHQMNVYKEIKKDVSNITCLERHLP